MGSDMFSVVVGLGLCSPSVTGVQTSWWCSGHGRGLMSSAAARPSSRVPQDVHAADRHSAGIAALALAKMGTGGYQLPMLDGKLDADMVMIS